MHRSWSSVCLNHYIASLKTILPKHHVESGARTFTPSKQISGQSAHGTGLIKNYFDTIDNGVENLDFAHDQVDIQRQEKTSILANSLLVRKCKKLSQFSTCTESVLYTTTDSSKIQLLKLCSQAEVHLYFLNQFLNGLLPQQNLGQILVQAVKPGGKYLNDLSSQYKMKELPPIQRSILLSDGITDMPVTCFNLLEQIRSFLDDQLLMTQDNCLFSFKVPYAIQMEADVRGDLNQSWFWYETQRAQCTSCSDFFAPIVVFIDSTLVNRYGKVNVEPIMFTWS